MYIRIVSVIYMVSFARILMLKFNVIDIVILLSCNYMIAKASANIIVLVPHKIMYPE
jgi:hypothetical protein